MSAPTSSWLSWVTAGPVLALLGLALTWGRALPPVLVGVVAVLLAVAVLPAAAGLTGADYTDPAAFAGGFRTAMVLSAGLLAAGGLLAALTISDAEVRAARVR